ncbi:MAG: hypothetical protein U0441_13085 [Polyangiaceae bacterium]
MRARITAILAITLATTSVARADEPAPDSGAKPPQRGPAATSPPTIQGETSTNDVASATDDPAKAIAEARRAVEDQRYDDALALLSPLLSSRSRGSRAAALEITAVVRLLVGKAEEGREAVASLYEMAPAFQLDDPSLPPRVTRVFEAEAAIPHARAVTLAIRPAEKERGLFEITTTQPAASIDLACASSKTAPLTPVAVTRITNGFHFRLPTLTAHRCFAIARDADALPLGRLGSATAPVNVAVPPPPPETPIYARWWLWTGIAAVAAAAVVTGVAIGTSAPGAPPAADLTLRPQQAVLSW